jgi:hypothetical protein
MPRTTTSPSACSASSTSVSKCSRSAPGARTNIVAFHRVPRGDLAADLEQHPDRAAQPGDRRRTDVVAIFPDRDALIRARRRRPSRAARRVDRPAPLHRLNVLARAEIVRLGGWVLDALSSACPDDGSRPRGGEKMRVSCPRGNGSQGCQLVGHGERRRRSVPRWH